MDNYFKEWLTVIDGMNNENNYKLAWGRAILELCHSFDVLNRNIEFNLIKRISHILSFILYLHYYTNKIVNIKLSNC